MTKFLTNKFIIMITRNKQGKFSWWKIAISIYLAIVLVIVLLSIIFGMLMMIFNPEALETVDPAEVETTEVVEPTPEPIQESEPIEEVPIEEVPTATAVDLTIDTELGFGEFIVGEDIEPGAYRCTVNPGEDETGAITVYGKIDQGGPLRSETSPESEGKTAVTIDVEEGDTIKITGISSVHFEPID